MTQEDGGLDPATERKVLKGTRLVTLLGPPLAFGAISSLVIGGLGLGAADALPAAGKLIDFLRDKTERVLPKNGELSGE
ncbi:MAG: hypothetical protein WCH05_06755 [Chlorobiaceae bacterium]